MSLAPAVRIQRPILQQLRPALAQMKMNCRADQRVPNIVRKTMTVQNICLLPLGDLPQALVQLPQGFPFLINLFRRFGGRFRHHRAEAVRSGEAETEGVSARQVKTGKKFARRRKDFAKPRCSESRTGFTDARGAARDSAKSRDFEKSIPLAYEEGIDRRVSSGFEQKRSLHQTAKQVFGNSSWALPPRKAS